MSKGDRPRPVNRKVYEDNWDKIFKSKKCPKSDSEKPTKNNGLELKNGKNS